MHCLRFRLAGLSLAFLIAFLATSLVRSDPPQGQTESPSREAIEGLFVATQKSWPTGTRIRLTYRFDTATKKLVEDFFPSITPDNLNIRFATPGDRRRTGLITAEFGQFWHKARWKNVTMDMSFTSYSQSKKGDLIAAALTHKGKRAMGCNMGKAMVQISGGKIVGKPIPRVFPQAARRTAIRFGCEYKEGTFSCRVDGSASTDAAGNPIETSKLPKWLKKAKTGHVGFIWRGQTQGYIDEIVIEGELDEEWLAKILGKAGK